MKYEELSKQQRDDEETFSDFLIDAGWTPYANAELIRSGFSVTPEARGELETEYAKLGIELFLQEQVILFSVVSDSAEVGLALHYVGSIKEIMDWLLKYQASMTRINLPTRIQELYSYAREVMFIAEDGKQYELKRYTGTHDRADDQTK